MSDIEKTELLEKHGVPSGVEIRNDIERIGWDVMTLTKYCVELRNRGMASTTISPLVIQSEKEPL
jgi:hypothetical protein